MKDGPTTISHLTPRDLLPGFYKQYGLPPDGGQSSSFVKLEVTRWFYFYIPNWDARRRAVFKHDVHHMATGYPSNFRGELDIAAWEIGSGCRNYWAAFFLNLSGLMLALLIYPVRSFRTFIKGRNTRNLYDDRWTDEMIMDSSLQAIREHMELTRYEKSKATFADWILLAGIWLIGALYSILSVLLFPFIVFYTLYILVTGKGKIEG
jgi:hypothetical protein